ncbi:MAG TPA: hypothetical protein VIZ68_00110 [Thermoplasmata archaeon]
MLVIRKRPSASTIFFAFGPGIGTRIDTPLAAVGTGDFSAGTDVPGRREL